MLALIGQSVLDTVYWPDGRIEDRLGGAPLFAACALAATGALVITHGASRRLLQALYAWGLPVFVGPSRRTTRFEVRLHGDGEWHESITALGDPFTPDDVKRWMAPALQSASAVVCGTQWRGDFPPETLSALADGGRRIYLDGQGAARPPRLGPVELEGPLDRAAVRGVHVLKLSEDEANALIGGIDAKAAEATGVPVVVVTRGARGATVLTGGVATDVAADPVRGLVDTVGAGDAFLAMLAAAATRGADPVLATRIACVGVAELLRDRLHLERDRQLATTGSSS